MKSVRRSPRSPSSGPAKGGTDSGAPRSEAAAWTPPPTRAAFATHATRLGLWAALACGPLGLLIAGASGGDAAPAASLSTHEPAERSGRTSTGPAGFAELYVAAYLRAGSSNARAGRNPIKDYFPGAPPLSGDADRLRATRTVTVAAAEVSPGYWNVTVAADVVSVNDKGSTRSAGLRFYAAPIRAWGGPESGGNGPKGSPPAYVAAALPAEVAAPNRGDDVELDYGKNLPTSGPLADAVNQFLDAYLTGAAPLDRYLSPHTRLSAVTPAPYRDVESRALASQEEPPATDGVQADGKVFHVLVTAEATDHIGQKRSLSYALTMTTRAGRWEVAGLEPAPRLRPPSGSPSESPSPTPSNSASPTASATSGSPGPSTAPSTAPGSSPSDSGAASPSSSP